MTMTRTSTSNSVPCCVVAILIVVCLNLTATVTAVNGATIVSQLSYSPGSQCTVANFDRQTNWTAGTCRAEQKEDISYAYYCNADGSYAYLAQWTGATCDGTPVSLQRYETGTACSALYYSTQWQCTDNTGPYLPSAFASWPPGNDWVITSGRYLNLTSGLYLSTCPTDTTGLDVTHEVATRYGYCARISTGVLNGSKAIFDNSQYTTCPNSAQIQYIHHYVGSTTCNSSTLSVIVENNGKCQSIGDTSTCGSNSGGATGSIQVGVKTIVYSDSTCGNTTETRVSVNHACFEKRRIACIEQDGGYVVSFKQYFDPITCEDARTRAIYKQNTCVADPSQSQQSFKFSCFNDGGGVGGVAVGDGSVGGSDVGGVGVGGVGAASVISISIMSVTVTIVMTFLGAAARSF